MVTLQQSSILILAGSAIALLSTYAGQASDLRSWLAGAEINRDGNLRLQ